MPVTMYGTDDGMTTSTKQRGAGILEKHYAFFVC